MSRPETTPKRLLILAPLELARDPRARRAALAARERGLTVVGLSGRVSGEAPLSLDGVRVVRVGRAPREGGLPEAGSGERRRGAVALELAGIYRLLRLVHRTVQFWGTRRELGRFEIVHANDIDTLPAAFLLARASGARLVYDAHEIYSEFDERPPRFYRFAVVALEGFLARRADAVVTVSEPIAEVLQERLRLSRLPTVVMNCPEREDREPAPPRPGRLQATYLGWLGGPGRLLEDVLEAMLAAPEVELTLRLVRADLGSVRARIDALDLADRVRVVEPVQPDALIDALRDFDVGLVIDRPVSRNSELVLPNKLFEYLMAGLAVVAPRLPGLTPLVEGERVGLTFEPGQASSLAAVLERLASDRELLAEMQHRARQAALERYNAPEQARELVAAWGI